MRTRVWFAREAQFTADPKIQMLGHEFGPVGPLLVEEVFALAKLADANGQATMLYAQIASRAFTTAARARLIIARAVDLGVIRFDGEPNVKGCSIDLPQWHRWQIGDASAADRKAAQRVRDAAAQRAEVSHEGHAAERDNDVTCHAPTPTQTESVGRGPAPSTPEITDGRVLEALEILRSAPRLQFDPLQAGVANTLAAFPNADHVQAAHIAVSNAANPNYRTTDAARALRYAIAEVERTNPKRGDHPAGRTAKSKPWADALKPLIDKPEAA